MPTFSDVFSLAGFDLFAFWILFFGGAEMIAGTIFAYFINFFAKRWDARGIRFFVWAILIFKNVSFAAAFFKKMPF